MVKKYFTNFLILLFTFYAFSGCAFPSNSTYSDSISQGTHSTEEIVIPQSYFQTPLAVSKENFIETYNENVDVISITESSDGSLILCYAAEAYETMLSDLRNSVVEQLTKLKLTFSLITYNTQLSQITLCSNTSDFDLSSNQEMIDNLLLCLYNYQVWNKCGASSQVIVRIESPEGDTISETQFPPPPQ